jgi:hypothetical protein
MGLMADRIDATSHVRVRRFPSALLVVTSLYGLLYLAFFIMSFIPSPEGNPVSSAQHFDPFDLEQIYVKLLFVLFVVGYVFSWKNRLIAGLIFLIWFGLIVCLDHWVSSTLHRQSGGGIAMGLPLLVLGMLFIITWYDKKHVPN